MSETQFIHRKVAEKNSLTLRKRLKYIYFIFGRPFLDFSQLEALC